MSPDALHKPMRLIIIRFPNAERTALIERIKTFAQTYGFAIRLSDDATHPGEIFLQLYRGDMKMICATDRRRSEFDIALYKTPGHPAPMWALDQAIVRLQRIVEQIPNTHLSQQILATSDPTPENRDGQSPIRMALIGVQPGARPRLLEQFKAFAHANGFAIHLGQTTPDPENFAIDMFRDDIWISGFTPFTVREADFGFYDTYVIRPAKPEAVTQAFEALRRAVEQVQGVTFVERPIER